MWFTTRIQGFSGFFKKLKTNPRLTTDIPYSSLGWSGKESWCGNSDTSVSMTKKANLWNTLNIFEFDYYTSCDHRGISWHIIKRGFSKILDQWRFHRNIFDQWFSSHVWNNSVRSWEERCAEYLEDRDGPDLKMAMSLQGVGTGYLQLWPFTVIKGFIMICNLSYCNLSYI